MSIDMLLMAACSSSSSSTERSGVGEKSEATNPQKDDNFKWVKSKFQKEIFNWTISTQYTQQYYHLFQTFNMPWRRGTARILRGLPIQISRLIRTTYSVIYWHLCTIPLLQKITFVDRHVAIASRHLLLLLSLLERNLLLDVWEPPWQGATSPWPALCGRGAERLLLGKSWNLEGADWLPDAPKLLLHRLFRHPEYEMRGREGLSMYLLIKWLAMPA